MNTISLKHLTQSNGINKIKNYFNSDIQESKIMSKKLSKCIAAFDYFSKALIVLFRTSGGISIISFASTIGHPAGIASANFALLFCLKTRMIKTLLKNNKK